MAASQIDHRATASPAEPPPRPVAVAGTDADQGRLARLVELAVEYLGWPTDDATGDIERLSCRYGRCSIHWRRPPSAIQRSAYDLAALQVFGAPADHFTGVRPAGGGHR